MRKTLWTGAVAASLSLGLTGYVSAQNVEAGASGALEGSAQPETTPVTPDTATDQLLPTEATPPLDDSAPPTDVTPPLDDPATPLPDVTTEPAKEAADTLPDTKTPAQPEARDLPKVEADSAATADFDPGFDLQGDADVGMTIGKVTTGSVAAQAGLQTNDRIISIDGRTFSTGKEFRSFARQLAGRQVPIIFERNGQQQTISVFYPQIATRTFAATGSRPWLGVYLEPDFNGTGAQVVRLAQGSPASRSGLRPGDVIVSLNGQDVYDYRDFVSGVGELMPNSSAELYVTRDGRGMPIIATVGRVQSTGYRGVETYNERYGYDQMPPAPDAWTSQSGSTTADEARMQRLERMIEQLQSEVRELRATMSSTQR